MSDNVILEEDEPENEANCTIPNCLKSISKLELLNILLVNILLPPAAIHDETEKNEEPNESVAKDNDDVRGGEGDEIVKEVTFNQVVIEEIIEGVGETDQEEQGEGEEEEDDKSQTCEGEAGDKGEDTTEEKQEKVGGKEEPDPASLSSGMRIAEQLVEEIVDHIIQASEEHLEGKPEVELESKAHTSLLTLKSENEQCSITEDVDEAQEAAVRLKQPDFKENVPIYHSLIAERLILKRKNSFLIKKIYEHYKRRNIEHLFKEIPLINIDLEDRYIRALLLFEEVTNTFLDDQAKMQNHIESLAEKRNSVAGILALEFQNLLERERETGCGLIFAKTAKPIPDKVVQKLIQRQVAKAESVAQCRLLYFKLKDNVTAEETMLKSLETVGENLTLMEYEQLKIKNQTCIEKLEEKDCELLRLRTKVTSAIQVLAELREKSHATGEDIESGAIILHDINKQLNETRSRLGTEKKRRDLTRSNVLRLRQEAGLLAEPQLLRDYKASVAERDYLSARLTELKRLFVSQKRTIDVLRKAIADGTTVAQRSNIVRGGIRVI